MIPRLATACIAGSAVAGVLWSLSLLISGYGDGPLHVVALIPPGVVVLVVLLLDIPVPDGSAEVVEVLPTPLAIEEAPR